MRPYSEASVPRVQPAKTEYRFTFTGSAREYFPIWLANVALTIITLGIYGPWAKVRRERYFYEHTVLGGSAFEYTAKPLSILKGRIIAATLLIAAGITGAISPVAQIVVILIILLATPWIINQTIRFKARYSLFRNIPFRFTGTYRGSIHYFMVLRFLAAIPLGLLIPLAKHQERRYVLKNLHFGGCRFNLQSSPVDFYKAYAAMLALLAVPLAMLFFHLLNRVVNVFSQSASAAQSAGEAAGAPPYIAALTALYLLAALLGAAVVKMGVAKATWNGARVGEMKVRYPVPLGRYLWLVICNAALRYGSLGLATPWCAVRLHRFKIEHLSLEGPTPLDTFVAARSDEIKALGGEAADAFDIDVDMGL